MMKYISRSKVIQCNRFFGTRWSSSVALAGKCEEVPVRNLTKDTMNPLIRKAEYAVMGELPARAEVLSKMLKKNPEKFKFDDVVFCNIGNPHIFNQKPITFFRQVSSLVENQDLLKKENRDLVSQLYPIDAIERAETLLNHIGHLGAYADSKGVGHIRENIAHFIERRDGYAADPETIFLTQGAGEGIHRVLQILHQPNQKSGVMIPIPQYPIYTAALQMMGSEPIPYYLDEKNQFALNPERLHQSIQKARSQGIHVNALAVINPGNPTGQCLSEENIQDVLQFCQEEGLVVLADEVYQANIFQPRDHPFHSFKKVLRSMGSKYDNQELFSFHSISKGVVGECGRRGGYVECVNVDPEVLSELYKMFSIFSGSNLQGQIMVDLMTNPPKKGDPSYPKYHAEVDDIQTSYFRRAQKLAECFHELEGVTCEDAKGAMYLFPRIRLPAKAIAQAKVKGMEPDDFYGMALLNATGICVVPGSGFGQEPGTLHIRCSFLPEEKLFEELCANIQTFHKDFMKQYK
ncbi:pyridoxal phosphate-dependent transferase [Sporodiniella umbellata]|nr:pyridoxal phosphate-dependent transferase [Sporodiniella umbellata]